MLSTIPGRSALTITPCTAATDPIGDSVDGQRSLLATTVVTASGGGVQAMPAAIAALIWKNLYEPTAAVNANSTATRTNMRFLISNLRFHLLRYRAPGSKNRSRAPARCAP